MKIKIKFNSPLILGFVLLSFLVFVLGIVTSGTSDQLLFMTYRSPLTSPLTYVRFFTHALGHVDWQHFLGNMSFILILGPMLEEKHGPRQLLVVMLAAAFVTGLLNFVLFSNVALCGASGIVFAFILLTSFTNFKEGEIPLTFILVAIVYIGQEIVNGIVVQDNVSNLSHITAGIVGAILGYQMNKRSKK